MAKFTVKASLIHRVHILRDDGNCFAGYEDVNEVPERNLKYFELPEDAVYYYFSDVISGTINNIPFTSKKFNESERVHVDNAEKLWARQKAEYEERQCNKSIFRRFVAKAKKIC